MRILLLFNFTFCFFHCAFSQTTFQRTYGVNGGAGWHVEKTSDNGYILAGRPFALIKTNAQGDTLWTKKSATGVETVYCIRQTSDGGYIGSGSYYNSSSNEEDALLIKTDSLGNVLWANKYGGIYNDDAFTVQQTFDGGYVMLGSSASFGTGNTDFDVYMIKTDANGDTLWTRLFGGTLADNGLSIQQTPDSGYIIAGYTESFGAGQSDIYLLKTDVNGNLEWSHTYGGAEADAGWSVRTTSEGGYIICGTTHSSVENNYGDICLIRTNSLGNPILNRAYGGLAGTEQGYYAEETADGGIIAIGETYSVGAGHSDCYLFKIDFNGLVEWSRTYGGSEFEHAYSLVQANDGGFAFVGTSNTFTNAQFYFVKTDNIGNSSCNNAEAGSILPTLVIFHDTVTSAVHSASNVTSQSISAGSGFSMSTLCLVLKTDEEVGSDSQLSIYPNPASGSFTVNFNGHLQIIDLTGRVIYQQRLSNPQSTVNIQQFSAGIYFVKVSDGEREEVKKLIIE
jgi:hypothetical protein